MEGYNKKFQSNFNFNLHWFDLYRYWTFLQVFLRQLFPLTNSLPISVLHSLMRFFNFFISSFWALYISWILVLYELYNLQNSFFYFVGCIYVQVMVVFALQIFSSIWPIYKMLILVYVLFVLFLFRKSYLLPLSSRLLPTFSSR